jgi:hypothetical protein
MGQNFNSAQPCLECISLDLLFFAHSFRWVKLVAGRLTCIHFSVPCSLDKQSRAVESAGQHFTDTLIVFQTVSIVSLNGDFSCTGCARASPLTTMCIFVCTGYTVTIKKEVSRI